MSNINYQYSSDDVGEKIVVAAKREALIDDAEAQLRKLSVSRGLDWDMMPDEERIDFVDDLIHEDREYSR